MSKLGRLSKQKSIMKIEANPLETGAVGGATMKMENLSDAKPISSTEFATLVSRMLSLENNEERLRNLEEWKVPYLFSSDQLYKMMDITTSIKTRIQMIVIIGPRLLDPRAKTQQFLDLFRFSEEKNQVEEVLKARHQALQSSVFSTASGGGGRGGGRGGLLGRGGRGAGAGGRGNAGSVSPPRTTMAPSAPVSEPPAPAYTTPPPVATRLFPTIPTEISPSSRGGTPQSTVSTPGHNEPVVSDIHDVFNFLETAGTSSARASRRITMDTIQETLHSCAEGDDDEEEESGGADGPSDDASQTTNETAPSSVTADSAPSSITKPANKQLPRVPSSRMQQNLSDCSLDASVASSVASQAAPTVTVSVSPPITQERSTPTPLAPGLAPIAEEAPTPTPVVAVVPTPVSAPAPPAVAEPVAVAAVSEPVTVTSTVTTPKPAEIAIPEVSSPNAVSQAPAPMTPPAKSSAAPAPQPSSARSEVGDASPAYISSVTTMEDISSPPTSAAVSLLVEPPAKSSPVVRAVKSVTLRNDSPLDLSKRTDSPLSPQRRVLEKSKSMSVSILNMRGAASEPNAASISDSAALNLTPSASVAAQRSVAAKYTAPVTSKESAIARWTSATATAPSSTTVTPSSSYHTLPSSSSFSGASKPPVPAHMVPKTAAPPAAPAAATAARPGETLPTAAKHTFHRSYSELIISPAEAAKVAGASAKPASSEGGGDDVAIRYAKILNMSREEFMALQPEEPAGYSPDGECVFYSYRELLRRNFRKDYGDLKQAELQTYMTADEFQKVFQKTKEQFEALAKWRQVDQKKRALLF